LTASLSRLSQRKKDFPWINTDYQLERDCRRGFRFAAALNKERKEQKGISIYGK
jgi:hypothetical protein